MIGFYGQVTDATKTLVKDPKYHSLDGDMTDRNGGGAEYIQIHLGYKGAYGVGQGENGGVLSICEFHR